LLGVTNSNLRYSGGIDDMAVRYNRPSAAATDRL
jgi:hypothetical protein